MNFIDLFIFAFAAYRIQHLIVFDKVFEPIRNYFVKRKFMTGEYGPGLYYFLQGGPIRRLIGQILNCFWCSGVWVAAAVVILYALYPPILGVYLILCVAGITSLVETWWAKTFGITEMMPGKKEDNASL